jgi:hypothetical protein
LTHALSYKSLSHIHKSLATAVLLPVLATVGLAVWKMDARMEGNRLKAATKPAEQVEAITSSSAFLYKHLQIGMSKEEVASIMPEAQNRDNRRVWIWIKPRDRQPTGADFEKWENLRMLGDGYFLVFHEGRLVSPLGVLSADDPAIFLR